MNFSRYNKNITYSYTYGGSLKVCGKGKVCEGDLDVEYNRGKGRGWADEYVGLEFEKGITTVGDGFLEGFRNLEYIVIPYTLKAIEVTPKLKDFLKKRRCWSGAGMTVSGSVSRRKTASRSGMQTSWWAGRGTKST